MLHEQGVCPLFTPRPQWIYTGKELTQYSIHIDTRSVDDLYPLFNPAVCVPTRCRHKSTFHGTIKYSIPILLLPSSKYHRVTACACITISVRVSNRKYGSLQIQSTTVFPSRSTLGMIETIPQIGKALEKFAPNAILNC